MKELFKARRITCFVGNTDYTMYMYMHIDKPEFLELLSFVSDVNELKKSSVVVGLNCGSDVSINSCKCTVQLLVP